MGRTLVPALFAAVLWSLSGATLAGAELRPAVEAADEYPFAAPVASPVGEGGNGPATADVTGAPLAKAETGADTPAPDTISRAPFEGEEELAEYDPWMKFNEKTFAFNYGLDRRVIKPVAKVYNKVVPNFVQQAVKNVFENVGSFRRIINTALQGRFDAMGQEFGRFFINTVFGLGGFIDAAPSFGVGKLEADTGQTFGVWGLGPGPYLVVPVLPPLTVRDATGFAFDVALDPLTWVAPFLVTLGLTAEKTVNQRSLNLELFENVEETVFDLYSAVRNGYLQRRQKLVQEGIAGSPFGRRERLILSTDR